MNIKIKLMEWLVLSKPYPPWIVFRRDGGWHVDWEHPEWQRIFHETIKKATRLKYAHHRQ